MDVEEYIHPIILLALILQEARTAPAGRVMVELRANARLRVPNRPDVPDDRVQGGRLTAEAVSQCLNLLHCES